MPDPLSSDVATRLKSDPTAALAAALILAGSFPDLVSWWVWLFSGKDGDSDCETNASGAGGSNGVGLRGPSIPSPRAALRRVRRPPGMTRRCWR